MTVRILILGAGAVGGFFGARLLQAGADVSFLVRAPRARLLRESGLRLHSAHGEDFRSPVRALSAVDGHFDLIVLACKAWDLDSAITAIAPAVGPASQVLPLLNGMRQLDLLDAAFGAERVLGGVAHVSATLEPGGAIRQFGTLERLTYGSRNPLWPVADGVVRALGAIRSEVRSSDDILGAMWDKFAFIASLAGITCLMRAPLGVILATADGEALVRRLYASCAEVAARSGHALPSAAMQTALASLTARGSTLKASMLRDLERGSRTECEHVLGDLLRRAVGLGLDAPLLSAALSHLRVYEALREGAA